MRRSKILYLRVEKDIYERLNSLAENAKIKKTTLMRYLLVKAIKETTPEEVKKFLTLKA